MSLKEGQLVTYAIDEIIETVQNLTPMASKTTKNTPAAASMQRSSNTVWMPVEQEAPTQTGWDLTGKQTNVLELSVKCNMGDPDNDFFQLRADDLRDERSYRRRIQASAKKLANNIETAIAKQATDMGSLVVHDSRTIGPATGLSGWDFLSSAEELMFARELNRDMGISYFLNPSDYRKAGRDLTAGDIFGRVPEEAYHNGTIQRQVAGFDDVMRSPKLPTVVGSTVTGVTVTGAQKFKPQAFTTDTDGNNENVDIDSAIGQNLGNDTLRRYKQANAIYADEANKLQNTRLKNVIMKGDLTPEVVNNMLFSKNKSEVQNLYRSVGQVGRAQMRNGIIGKAMEKSGGSPDQFLRQVNLMSNQTGIAFKGRDAAYLKGLKSYLEATKRAGQAGVTTPTGQQAVPFVAAAAAIASPKFAAIGGGYGVLARLYESEIGRNAVLRLANTPRGSTTFEKALSDVERVLNSVAQGAKSESLRE